jgi:hypothetical protein
MKLFSFFGRGALILASAGLALACSKMDASSRMANTTTTPVAVTTPPVPASAPAQNPEDKMPRIGVEEAKKLVDAGKAVIIDVRGTEAYKTAHVKGALDYPLPKIEAKDFSGLPKNKRIIAYCT